jgi:hypothetical protein
MSCLWRTTMNRLLKENSYMRNHVFKRRYLLQSPDRYFLEQQQQQQQIH